MSDRDASAHAEWVSLREEIWACRETADVALRYFRSRADQYRVREYCLAIASFISQSSGVVAVFGMHPIAALLLVIFAGAITTLGFVLRYGDRRAEHQLAARTANNSHGRWSALWRELGPTAPTRAAIQAARRDVASLVEADKANMNGINEDVDWDLWREKELEVRLAMGSHEILPDPSSGGPLAPEQEDRSSDA